MHRHHHIYWRLTARVPIPSFPSVCYLDLGSTPVRMQKSSNMNNTDAQYFIDHDAVSPRTYISELSGGVGGSSPLYSIPQSSSSSTLVPPRTRSLPESTIMDSFSSTSTEGEDSNSYYERSRSGSPSSSCSRTGRMPIDRNRRPCGNCSSNKRKVNTLSLPSCTETSH